MKRRYDLGLYKISEIEWIPKGARSISFTNFEEIYKQVRETVRWMVAEGRYSKRKIIKEVSTCYGLAPEYAELFVKEGMDEFNAVEVNGEWLGGSYELSEGSESKCTAECPTR